MDYYDTIHMIIDHVKSIIVLSKIIAPFYNNYDCQNGSKLK